MSRNFILMEVMYKEWENIRDQKLADREALGALLRKAHPTVDHYLPALTIAGAADMRDALTFMTDSIDLGSVSMRSFVFHTA